MKQDEREEEEEEYKQQQQQQQLKKVYIPFFFSITLTCLHAYTPKLKRRRSPAGFKECKHESFKEIKK